MKQKIIIFTLFTLLMPALSLQAGIRIGAKAGVNLAKATLNSEVFQAENFTGFQIGPILEISGLSGLGIDAAVLYSQHGLKIKGEYTASPLSSAVWAIEYEEKVSTLDIPVNLKMKFSLVDIAGIYVSSGPYISFKLDDKTTFEQIRKKWGSKDFGVGLNFGGGVILLKRLQVGVNYQLSLNDNYGNFTSDWTNELKDLGAKNRIWSITAAFFF